MEHLDSLYAGAMRLTRNAADADDLIQETFLKGWKAYERFEAGTNLRAWLYRIMTNTFITGYRKKQRRPDETELGELEDFYLYKRLDAVGGSSRSAEDQLVETIADVEIKDALDALPEQFRMAVYLADVEGFAYQEIADITDVPIGTVMSRIHRGRKALQKQLYDYAADRGLVPVGADGAEEGA